jgi:REP element-mobilizing transposase RayT
MVFHVLNRGVRRGTLFDKDQDFLAFERVVEEALRTCAMRLCAYCLMSNHWHFVVWPEHDGDPAWVVQTAKRLNLESTLRSRGRPRKER